jgi:hypothetical protein
MIFNFPFVFTILFITINANPFENALNKVNNQLDQIKNDSKMGFIEKYVRIYILNQKLKLIKEAKELNETEKENEAKEDQIKLKLLIFNRHLANRMGASSFNKDFHTIRY